MDIAVLCRRLSDNTFVRSYLLLQTLEATVDVYGVVDGRGVHPFFDRDQFDFHTISTGTYGEWDGESLDLARGEHLLRQGIDAVRLWRSFRRSHPDPDVVFVASGWKGSLGAGLLARHLSHRDVPLVVDVYDHTDWLQQVPLVDPLAYVDAVLASNRPLAELLGGQVIHTPVDVDQFDPDEYDRTAVRAELGFDDDHTVVGFVGTPRPEKGLDALIEAVETAGDDVRGLVVGAGEQSYTRTLREAAGDDVTFVPPVAHSEVPRYYAALDALVLAQQRRPYCEYQIPAKLFEAMSMRTPVIATGVGDIPYVLDDAGIVIDESTPEAVRAAIAELAAADAAAMGRRGRERVREHFSGPVAGDRLEALLAELVDGGP